MCYNIILSVYIIFKNYEAAGSEMVEVGVRVKYTNSNLLIITCLCSWLTRHARMHKGALNDFK